MVGAAGTKPMMTAAIAAIAVATRAAATGARAVLEVRAGPADRAEARTGVTRHRLHHRLPLLRKEDRRRVDPALKADRATGTRRAVPAEGRDRTGATANRVARATVAGAAIATETTIRLALVGAQARIGKILPDRVVVRAHRQAGTVTTVAAVTMDVGVAEAKTAGVIATATAGEIGTGTAGATATGIAGAIVMETAGVIVIAGATPRIIPAGVHRTTMTDVIGTHTGTTMAGMTAGAGTSR
jgi:hypothetical protein